MKNNVEWMSEDGDLCIVAVGKAHYRGYARFEDVLGNEHYRQRPFTAFVQDLLSKGVVKGPGVFRGDPFAVLFYDNWGTLGQERYDVELRKYWEPLPNEMVENCQAEGFYALCQGLNYLADGPIFETTNRLAKAGAGPL